MKLSVYLKQNELRLAEFAAVTGVPYQTLYTTVHRPWIIPSADLALRIIEATGGAVTLQDLVIKSKYARRSRSSGPEPPPDEIPASPEMGQEISNSSHNCG